MDFFRALINTVVSESAATAEPAYAAWRAAREARNADDAYMSQRYTDEIDLPRAERARAYDDYLAEIERLRDAMRAAPSGQKARVMQEYIAAVRRVPEELKQPTSTVFTKNVMMYK